MAEEQQKKKDGPSKGELKKLAKKAEKDAKKAAKKAGGKGGGGGGGGGGKAEAAPAAAPAPAVVVTDVKPTFYLTHAALNDAATLKAAVASIAFDVPLKPAKAVPGLDPILHGPALVTDKSGGVAGSVAFGGNGVAKALSLLGAGGTSGGTGTGARAEAKIDDWLEYERSELRLALKKGNPKKIDKALTVLEVHLSGGGGDYLVGDTLTAADVAVVVALTSPSSGAPDLSKHASVASYTAHHAASPPFTKGADAVPALIPPPPFDFLTNPSLSGAVAAVFTAAVSKAFPISDTFDLAANKLVVKCNQLKHGDYQCNAAMPIFQKLKKSGGLPPGTNTPQDIAAAIIAAVPAENPAIDCLEVNGPGFVLCRIKGSYLQGHMNTLISTGTVPKPSSSTVKPEHCVVDFSSPNIAKEMHVGHLRSTIIGEAVCRVLEYAGCKVERVNHVGDWGTQFGMLIQYLREEYPDFHKDHEQAESSISDLTVFYKNAKKRFDDDEAFKDASRTNVVALQSGDPECREIWQILCDVSRREFLKVYKRLDITLEEVGESFYNKKIPPVIEEFEKKGLISVQEGGAKCVFMPGYQVPLMLQKSDGGFGYDSTDMAALKYRLSEIKATRLVYITDFGQGDHFKLCFAAASSAKGGIGWVGEDPNKGAQRLCHIGFGTVMGEDGKRFKTRSGETVRLVDLLDEAVGRMERSLAQRLEDGTSSITADEVHATACALGYGAVKYFDLRRNPTTNYKFSYDQMLDTKGNTAIYLLYAHARLESIITKAAKVHGTNVDELIKTGTAQIVVQHKCERTLAMHLRQFADVIEETLEDLYPYHICDYLYAVSNAVSDFVTQCRVLGSPEMESRLLMCRATAIVMRQCFDLLAIRHVMRI